jgi:uncharacterized protein YidB (DUF937 family)
MAMSVFKSVIGALGQAQAQAQPGTAQSPVPTSGDMLGTMMGLAGGGGGDGAGLDGLVQQFQKAGLGDVVASWIGTGQNLPITAEQLGQVLGQPAMQAMAQQTGVDARTLLAQLAQVLPMLVDQLTPDGKLPQGGQLGPAALKNLAGMLGGQTR